jgi:hypothetical protein
MATLTAHRPPNQRSLLDPYGEVRVPAAPTAPPPREAPAPDAVAAPAPRGATLDDLVAGRWDALLDGRTASGPVCAGELSPRYGAGPRPVGGACRSCGSQLG